MTRTDPITGKRQRYGGDFKAKVALEAIRGELTTSQLASKHGVHQTMINDWKRLAISGLASLFDGKGAERDVAREGEVEKLIERLWRSLKYECVYLHTFETGSELRGGLTQWVGYYNARRPHSSLGGRTPDEAYAAQGRHWVRRELAA